MSAQADPPLGQLLDFGSQSPTTGTETTNSLAHNIPFNSNMNSCPLLKENARRRTSKSSAFKGRSDNDQSDPLTLFHLSPSSTQSSSMPAVGFPSQLTLQRQSSEGIISQDDPAPDVFDNLFTLKPRSQPSQPNQQFTKAHTQSHDLLDLLS